MPRPADRTLSISLCIAVAAHVLIALAVIELQNNALRRKLEDGSLFANILPRNQRVALVPFVQEQEPERPWRLFGEHDGIGEGTHRADGDQPASGRPAPQDQPFLSRDPAGPGDIGNLPSLSLEPRGEFGDGGDRDGGREGRRLLSNNALSQNTPPVLFGPQLNPADRQPVPPKHQAPMVLAMETPGDADSQRTGGRAGTDRAPADPAPMGDSEVDSFSRNKGEVIIQAGKVEPRIGRKVKTLRPRLNLASLGSILSLPDPVLRVGVRFDDTGKVRHVTILESSGSNELDQPTVVCLYDWWFEPLADKNGTPQGDTVVLSINFR